MPVRRLFTLTKEMVKVIMQILLVLGTAVPFLLQAAPDSNDQDRVVITGNLHLLAKPEFDRGPVSPSLQMARMLMVLTRTRAQQSDLDGLLTDVQTPSSIQYHRWLTPSEFGRRFGPSDKQIQAVTSWLRGQGFESIRVSAGRTAIEFSGTAAKVEGALNVQIHKFVIEGKHSGALAAGFQRRHSARIRWAEQLRESALATAHRSRGTQAETQCSRHDQPCCFARRFRDHLQR